MSSRRIDIGGRCLALEQIIHPGRAEPLVIFETGLLAESSAWQAVFDSTAGFASVVRYDRAGRGLSDSAPLPRTIQDLANDLFRLLQAAKLSTPWLLVGQSIGGWVVRCFAAAHPAETAGLVLVDPTHPDQFTTMSALLPPAAAGESPSLQRFRSFWSEGYRHPEQNREGIDFPASITAMQDFQLPPGLPVTVLTSGTNLNEMEAPPELRQRLHAAWVGLHASLVPPPPMGRHTILPESGHFIQRDDPRAVMQAIQDMLYSK
jgi:pimeloyl-ACP methyl ester carboxylesterase